MATKKPLMEAEQLSESPQLQKNVAVAKASPVKVEFVEPLAETKQKLPKREKNNNSVSDTKEAAADQLIKIPAKKSLEKDAAEPDTKNLKGTVKKTLISDINENKEMTGSKKEAALEKKTKAATAEKDIKSSKASLKASKPDEASKPIVIPKTSTDKKVDYEPDFLKSVLDSPAVAPAGPTMRYSDAELQEFRELIAKKLDAAKKELAYLQGLITRRDEMGGDETDNRYMTMEDGGMSMEREQLSQMASRQITFTDHLEKALMRIENKTYGICRVTGKLIDKARLRAVPHATLSMEAKVGITK